MTVPEVWHIALSIIADFSPMTYWEMSNGARYWWTLTSRHQLGDDRFTEQPFSTTFPQTSDMECGGLPPLSHPDPI